MKNLVISAVFGALGALGGMVAAEAVFNPYPAIESGSYTHCEAKEVFEDGSFVMVCPPIFRFNPEGLFPND